MLNREELRRALKPLHNDIPPTNKDFEWVLSKADTDRQYDSLTKKALVPVLQQFQLLHYLRKGPSWFES